MLKAIRKNIKKLGWPAAIMIVLAFVLWGAPRLFRGEKAPTFAGTVFDRRVSFDEYYASLRACIRQARMMYGDRFDLMRRYLNIEGQAWDRLILLAEAKNQGIRVSDDEVRRWIRSQPIFQTDGKFDHSKYRSLENPRAFEEEIRRSLAISKLVDSITGQVVVTDQELRGEYEREFARARVSYILVAQEDFRDEVALTEEELKNYYGQNRQGLQTPVQVNVEYLSFDYADYEKEEMAKDHAEEIFYELMDKPNLAKVARENSLEVRETGFFTMEGPIPDIGFAPQFTVSAFDLEPGEISDPIYTTKGCYIISVKEIRQPYIPSFEEAEAKVREIVTGSKAWELCLKAAKEYHSRLQEMMERPGAKFEEAARTLNLDVKDSGLISRSDYIPGVGKTREFAKAAFSLNKGELSPPVKTEKGYAILRLEEYQPIDEEKFKGSIDEYRGKVLALKKVEAYNRWFDQLKKRANLKSYIR